MKWISRRFSSTAKGKVNRPHDFPSSPNLAFTITAQTFLVAIISLAFSVLHQAMRTVFGTMRIVIVSVNELMSGQPPEVPFLVLQSESRDSARMTGSDA